MHEQMNFMTSGSIMWPRTKPNVTVYRVCPVGSAGTYAMAQPPHAARFCDASGHWQEADLSYCHFENDMTRSLETYAHVSTVYMLHARVVTQHHFTTCS